MESVRGSTKGNSRKLAVVRLQNSATKVLGNTPPSYHIHACFYDDSFRKGVLLKAAMFSRPVHSGFANFTALVWESSTFESFLLHNFLIDLQQIPVTARHGIRRDL